MNQQLGQKRLAGSVGSFLRADYCETSWPKYLSEIFL
jgi:hypothetical protein